MHFRTIYENNVIIEGLTKRLTVQVLTVDTYVGDTAPTQFPVRMIYSNVFSKFETLIN